MKDSKGPDQTRQSILVQIKDEAQKIREVAHQQGLHEGRQLALAWAQVNHANRPRPAEELRPVQR